MAAQGYMQRRNPLRDIWERLASGDVTVAAAGVVTEADAVGEGSYPIDLTSLQRDEVNVLHFIPAEFRDNIRSGISTDDVAAYLQAAITICKKLYFPPGLFYTTNLLVVPSNRYIRGAGRGLTTIYNDQSHATLDRRAAFLVGDMHPYVYRSSNPIGNKFPSYAIDDVTVTASTARRVKTTTVGDAANFAPGDFVSVYSTAGLDQSTNVRFPDYLQHNKVVSADPATGFIVLEHPHKAANAGMNIAKVAGTDPYMGVNWYMAENVVIEDMTVDAYTLTARGGQYNCRFSNIKVKNATFGIWTNACVRTKYENITGTWIFRALELKMGSEQVLIDNCQFDHIFDAANEPAGGWDIGEHSTDIMVRNSQLYIAPFTPANGTDMCNPVRLSHCARITITGNTIRTYAKADGIFNVVGSNNSSLQSAYSVQISGNMLNAIASTAERVFYLPGIFTYRPQRVVIYGNTGDVTLGSTNRVWDLVCGINISGFGNEFKTDTAGNIDAGNVTLLGMNPLFQWTRIAPVDGTSGTKYPFRMVLEHFAPTAGAPCKWINLGTATNPIWHVISTVAA